MKKMKKKVKKEKSTIFLSYFQEEVRLARILKQRIQEAFSDDCTVFMSSDNIPHGKDWLSELKQALEDCKIIILSCSPISVKKEWIHFEAGCAYMREVPLIIICHSGLLVEDLPENLKRFQSVEIPIDIKELRKLFKSIKDYIDYKKPISIDYLDVMNEINDEIPKSYREYIRVSKVFSSVLSNLKTNVKSKVQIEFTKQYLKKLKIEVKSAKFHLKELGYYSGNLDNKVTATFIDSVYNFQDEHSVEPADGILGKITYESIVKAVKSKNRKKIE